MKGGQRIEFAQDYEQSYGYGEGSFDADDGSVVQTMDKRYDVIFYDFIWVFEFNDYLWTV